MADGVDLAHIIDALALAGGHLLHDLSKCLGVGGEDGRGGSLVAVGVAMSCGLTQRGALPLLPEAVRVQAALACGADLVFALPAPCACAGAEAFARAGVRILAAAGCDALVFGAETRTPPCC